MILGIIVGQSMKFTDLPLILTLSIAFDCSPHLLNIFTCSVEDLPECGSVSIATWLNHIYIIYIICVFVIHAHKLIIKFIA